MRTRPLFYAFSGAVAGIAFVLACGDDDPAPADAADAGACMCPAAEPPIAGRVVQREQRESIGRITRGSVGAACEAGETLLSGTCRLAETGTDTRGVTLEAFEADGALWRCRWFNDNDREYTMITTALCLVPPSSAQ
jgi:hypothetical protein